MVLLLSSGRNLACCCDLRIVLIRARNRHDLALLFIAFGCARHTIKNYYYLIVDLLISLVQIRDFPSCRESLRYNIAFSVLYAR